MQAGSRDERRPSLGLRMVIMVVAVLLLIGLIAGGKYLLVMKQIASFKPPPPPVVSTTVVHDEEWRERIDTVGSLRAWRGTDLSAEVAGQVREVRFRSGAEVAEGAELFVLNADPERAQLAADEAAAELAHKTLARDRDQLAAHAVSQATVDADEADARQKDAQVLQQKDLIAKKIIRAPFAGRTGITTVNPGLYLNPGDKVVTLQSIDTLYLDFNVPQRELGRLHLGTGAELLVDTYPGRHFKGTLTAIGSLVDVATRNVQVEATVRNADHALLPGMFGKVGLEVGKPARLVTIPQAAVTYNPYGATVFIVQPGKDGKAPTVQQVFIKTGATRGDQVAALEGVKSGDTVVTSGQLKLSTGNEVAIDNRVQPANDAHPTPQEQ